MGTTDLKRDRLQVAAEQWTFPEGVVFLNHGSFGPTPACVLQAREKIQREHAANPMDFFLRKMEPMLDEACEQLARFLNCPADNLVFVTNATAAMNIIAENLPLQHGDEVLITDHGYGAVTRVWGHYCQKAGAKTVLARLPEPVDTVEGIIETILEKVTPRTKLLVIDHITSPTATIFPVAEITRRARERGLLVAIDGPHAVGMVDVDLQAIDCDFYAASCHKWVSAPLGSGFLYVRSRFKQGLRPNVVSWGRSVMGRPPSWKDEFHWPGTFDPSPWLAIPSALEFLKSYGVQRFRQETRELCQFAREQLLSIAGTEAVTPAGDEWSGTMVTVRLPISDAGQGPNQRHPLQNWLWDQYRIEIPIVRWHDDVHVRASCHLYNAAEQYTLLKQAIEEWMEESQ